MKIPTGTVTRLVKNGFKVVDLVPRDPADTVRVSPTWANSWVVLGVVPDDFPGTQAFLEDFLPDWKIVLQDRIGNESPVLQLADGLHPQGEMLVGYQQLGPAFGVNERGFYKLAREIGLRVNGDGEYAVPVVEVAIKYGIRTSGNEMRRLLQPRDPVTKQLIKGDSVTKADIRKVAADRFEETIGPLQARWARDQKRTPQLLSYREQKAKKKLIKELEAAEAKKKGPRCP